MLHEVQTATTPEPIMGMDPFFWCGSSDVRCRIYDLFLSIPALEFAQGPYGHGHL